MRTVLLAVAMALVMTGCSGNSEQTASQETAERDGFSGQVGVMAGDPSDYGD